MLSLLLFNVYRIITEAQVENENHTQIEQEDGKQLNISLNELLFSDYMSLIYEDEE